MHEILISRCILGPTFETGSGRMGSEFAAKTSRESQQFAHTPPEVDFGRLASDI